MVKFELPNRHYIRRIDPQNFGICKEIDMKRKTTKEKYTGEYIIGYAGTLKSALMYAIDILSLDARSNKELVDIIERLEKIKFSIKDD